MDKLNKKNLIKGENNNKINDIYEKGDNEFININGKLPNENSLKNYQITFNDIKNYFEINNNITNKKKTNTKLFQIKTEQKKTNINDDNYINEIQELKQKYNMLNEEKLNIVNELKTKSKK